MRNRWHLYEEIRAFQEEADRFFEDVIRRFQLLELALHRWAALPAPERPRAALTDSSWSALPREEPLRLESSGETLVAEILMPEVRPEELDLRLEGNRLIITGRYVHTIHLPPEVDPERVEATFVGGRLRITVREPMTVLRRIPIRTSEA